MGRKKMTQDVGSIVSKAMSEFYTKQNTSSGETVGLVIIAKDRILLLNL